MTTTNRKPGVRHIDISQYTILKTEAQYRMGAWDDSQNEVKNALKGKPESLSNVLSIKAFTFEFDDLYQLIEKIYHYNTGEYLPKPIDNVHNNPITAIRFYLGKDEDKDNKPGSPCLIAVGVTDFNTPEGSGGNDYFGEEPNTDKAWIYDFSYPCPTTCPSSGLVPKQRPPQTDGK